ncbi:MAG: hypothetical protein AAGK37_10120 [Pseudomonadota bacterium]
MMSSRTENTVLQFRSSRRPRPLDRRDITHVLSMRSGTPDAVPDEILAALTEASVFHTPLPGVGLGLILDQSVEAALQEEGFDLTRVAPDGDITELASLTDVQSLQGACRQGNADDPLGAPAGAHAPVDRPVGAGTELEAVSAMLLGAGMLAARGAQVSPGTMKRLSDRLDALEAAMAALAAEMRTLAPRPGTGG